MRTISTICGLLAATATIAAATQAALAQDVIIRTQPGASVTIIQPNPYPPNVVVRPASPPAAFYYRSPGVDAAYAGDSCGWLYRRAAGTGDPYWWDRYHSCAD